MADISDVENALVSLIEQIAYPTGTANPSVLLNAESQPVEVKVYRGWPIPANLDADVLADNIVNVSIYPMGVERNTTRYGSDYETLPLPAPTLTLIAAPTTLTVGGTVSTPQNVAAIVNGIGYSYGVQPGDTLTSIATGLAALINEDTACTSSGPVITIPSAHSIVPRIGVVGTAYKEVKRQTRNIMISVWCPDPALRDAAGKLFDPVLADRNFITLADTTVCRFIYVSSPVTDGPEKETVYRRDFIYSAEYATVVPIIAPQITVIEVNVAEVIEINVDGPAPGSPTKTTYI